MTSTNTSPNPKLHVRKNDTVVVISGTNKGKRGKVLSTSPKAGKVVVEGVAMVTKHQKPRGQGMPGGKIHKEAAIPASNVLLLCQKCGKATRTGHQVLEDKTKVRVCKKCGAAFDD
jgi:large subunit ribosomal protein L24